MDKQVKFIESLSKNMQNSIKKYTKDEYYESINDKIDNKEYLNQEEQDIVNALKLAFENVPPLEDSITVYRGITKDFIPRKSFISTSIDKDVAINFANDRTLCCLLIIHIPPGEKILPLYTISANKHEKEVLLNTNLKFYVTPHSKTNGYKTFELKVLNSLKNEDIKLSLDVKPDVDVNPAVDVKPAVDMSDDEVITRVKNIILPEEIELLGLDEAIDSVLKDLNIKPTKSLLNKLKFELS